MLEVTVYCINRGEPSQYYGLMTTEDNQILRCAPNNWKTIKGALNWAIKHGYKLSPEIERRLLKRFIYIL